MSEAAIVHAVDMTDSHLENSVALLRRRRDSLLEEGEPVGRTEVSLGALLAEQRRRQDGDRAGRIREMEADGIRMRRFVSDAEWEATKARILEEERIRTKRGKRPAKADVPAAPPPGRRRIRLSD